MHVTWLSLLLIVTAHYVCRSEKQSWKEPEDITSTCVTMIEDIAASNSQIKILSPSQLVGKWVSESCETRNGPQFLLRSYQFLQNKTFTLLQIYYEDDSCTSPLYTLTVSGSYTSKSRKTATVFKMIHDVKKVTVMILDSNSVNLDDKLKEICPNIAPRRRRNYAEFNVCSKQSESQEMHTDSSWPHVETNSFRGNGKRGVVQENYDEDCCSTLNLTLNELSTVRIQLRPMAFTSLANSDNFTRHELLLAKETRFQLPTLRSFQPPLLLANEAKECVVCKELSTSTKTHVPFLTAKPSLPFLISGGEWISTSCEPHSSTLFTTRHMKINPKIHSWHMERRFYTKYTCSKAVLSIILIGQYSVGATSNFHMGAFDIDFHTQKFYFLILDESILSTIQHDPLCSLPGYWKVGVMKEVLSKRGCPSLGVLIPTVRHDIAKIVISDSGVLSLYLGEDWASQENAKNRPTDYQYPLVQCSSELPQIFDKGDDDQDTDSGSTFTRFSLVTFLLTLRIIVYIFN